MASCHPCAGMPCSATGGRLWCRTVSCRHAAKWQHWPFPAGVVLAALSGPRRKQSLSPAASPASRAASPLPAPPAQRLSLRALSPGAGGCKATALPAPWLAGGLQPQLGMGLVPWVPLTWAQLDPSPAWLHFSPVPWLILQGDEPPAPICPCWVDRQDQGTAGEEKQERKEKRTHLFGHTGGDHAVGRVLRGVPSPGGSC